MRFTECLPWLAGNTTTAGAAVQLWTVPLVVLQNSKRTFEKINPLITGPTLCLEYIYLTSARSDQSSIVKQQSIIEQKQMPQNVSPSSFLPLLS